VEKIKQFAMELISHGADLLGWHVLFLSNNRGIIIGEEAFVKKVGDILYPDRNNYNHNDGEYHGA
jgi:hypothetical protein